MIVHLVQITARRICLPHLDQRTAHRPPVFIKHTPMHKDAFSERLAFMLRGQIMIVLANQSMPENWPRLFCQGLGKQDQRHAWRTRNGRQIRREVIVRLCAGYRGCNCAQLNQSPSSNAFHRQCDALAHSDTHGCESELAAKLLQLVRRCEHQPGAAHSERMAERDSPSRCVHMLSVVG